MRKCFIVLAFVTVLTASAQQQIRQVIKSMPGTEVPFLTENNWLDLFDFIDSNMKAEVSNRLDGKTTLLKLTDSYAQLRLNEASQMELLLLDVAEPVDSASQIVCVVRTLGVDVQESTVSFYSLRWRKLHTADYIELPQQMFTATLNEQNQLDIVSRDQLDMPAHEEQKGISSVLTTLKWNGRRFN